MRAKILKHCIKNLREFPLKIWGHEETMKHLCSKREYFHNIFVYIIHCFEFHLEVFLVLCLKPSQLKVQLIFFAVQPHEPDF